MHDERHRDTPMTAMISMGNFRIKAIIAGRGSDEAPLLRHPSSVMRHSSYGGIIAVNTAKEVILVAGLNRVILTGRLTKDPEVRYTKEQVPLAKFTVAVNEIKRKNGDAGVNYFNCVAWRGLAGICGEYLKKGSLVAIEGKMQFKSFESNGQKKQSTEVLVDNMLMLDKGFYKNAGNTGENAEEKEDDLVMAA